MAEQFQPPAVLQREQVPAERRRHREAAPRNSPLALAAFFTAAAAWVVIPLFGAVAAIILGILAGRQIRRARGRLKGSDLATAAIVVSGIQLGFIVIAVVGVNLAVPAG